MSRPKIPDISWRTCRITAAAAIALLLTGGLTLSAAQADPAPPPPPAKALLKQSAPLPLVLNSPLKLAHVLKHQAAVHSSPPRKAPAPPRRESPATRPVQRPTASSPQRASRSADRPALAPTLSGARAYAQSRMSSAQYSCLSNIISRESGWNPQAQNGSSGAYGLFQALPAGKMASTGADWQTNPLTQMRWGLSYIQERYGNPCAAWYFWTKNGWY